MSVRVGIIGAGVSALTCAQQLCKLAQVTVFEWGRGPGGRTARKRVHIEGSDVFFDHAAPYFEATTDVFRDGFLRNMHERGVAAPWNQTSETGVDASPKWVGVPSNNMMCKVLAEDLEREGGSIFYGTHVRSTQFVNGEWQVTAQKRQSEEEQEYRFDMLVFSDKLLLLPNQYAVLSPTNWGPLALSTSLTSSMVAVLLIALKESIAPASTIIYTERPGSILKMLIHDSAKPGRSTTPDLWVVHSTQEYAATRINQEGSFDDESKVLSDMREAFFAAVSPQSSPGISFETVFAWDHAQPDAASRMQVSHLLDRERKAGVCGDVFMEGVANGVEAAALSGEALGNAMLQLMNEGSSRSDL